MMMMRAVVAAVAPLTEQLFWKSALAGVLALLAAWASAVSAQSDMRYAYPQQLSVSPLGVNLQTGRFTHSVTDIAVGDLQLVRAWGDFPEFSQASRLFGTLSLENGWSHNFASGTQIDQNNYRMVAIGGTTYRYIVQPDGINFIPFNRSARGTLLVRSGSIFTLTTQSGDQHQFTAISAAATAVAGLRLRLHTMVQAISPKHAASTLHRPIWHLGQAVPERLCWSLMAMTAAGRNCARSPMLAGQWLR
jgi:hypothetical protein